jgi:riboflavin synthase
VVIKEAAERERIKMFTGLIREVGKLALIISSERTLVLEVQAPQLCSEGLQLGDSIGINGICLTLVALKGSRFKVEAGWETIQRTTLRSWKVGDPINLERSLPLNGRLDGHWVAGHVDGIAEVRSIIPEGESKRVTLEAPVDAMRFIAKKGSVTLDGVSLTVADLKGERGFTVAIIPHTLRKTTLGGLRPGDAVNFEVDLIARYLERLLANRDKTEGLSWGKLAAAGFISPEEGEMSSW